MVDFTQARRTMVDSQLRTFDVNDIPLLDVMDRVPRELFVLPGRQDLAYIDQDILVGDGDERRYMLKPMTLGRLIQALGIDAGARVLDVACGRGYSSAVMRALGGEVIALESDEALAEAARRSFAAAGVSDIPVRVGSLERGCADAAPYDAILVNGALDVRPDGLLRQLADGGRLVCVIGRGRAARAIIFVRSGNAYSDRVLFDVAAPNLSAFEAKPGFVF